MSFKGSRIDKHQKFGLNSFKDNWFTENGTLDGDFAWSIEVKQVVHREKSEYQDILVFVSSKFGRCLALDSSIRCTEKDEFAYNEMIAFLPLLSHPEPKKVLVIGGGDGGVVREVIKNPSVDSVILCEIDEAVMRVCREYLPFMAKGLLSPKLTIKVEDGVEFARKQKGQFDVIITDSPNAEGLANKRYEKPYFELLKAALRPNGVIASKGGCYWFDIDKQRQLLDMCRSVFPVVDYASTFAPSLPGGQIGILLCSVSPKTNFRKPIENLAPRTLKDFGLRYYTPSIHRAAFAHPSSFSKELGLRKEVYLN